MIEVVAKCEINDKAIKIISQPYSVRAVVKSDKVMFSVNDILYACGIKAPRKWVERNADKFPWMWADSYPYPTKTVKGWRTNKVVFVSAPGWKEAGQAHSVFGFYQGVVAWRSPYILSEQSIR